MFTVLIKNKGDKKYTGFEVPSDNYEGWKEVFKFIYDALEYNREARRHFTYLSDKYFMSLYTQGQQKTLDEINSKWVSLTNQLIRVSFNTGDIENYFDVKFNECIVR